MHIVIYCKCEVWTLFSWLYYYFREWGPCYVALTLWLVVVSTIFSLLLSNEVGRIYDMISFILLLISVCWKLKSWEWLHFFIEKLSLIFIGITHSCLHIFKFVRPPLFIYDISIDYAFWGSLSLPFSLSLCPYLTLWSTECSASFNYKLIWDKT